MRRAEGRARRVWLVFLLGLSSGMGAFAQGGPPQPAPAGTATGSESTGTRIKLRVNLVQVRVVARDAKGNPVAGLKAEDFQLFDNGKQQTIALFTEETRETRVERAKEVAKTQVGAPAGANPARVVFPDRFVLLMFDDNHMGVSEATEARKAAQKFVENLSPTDRVGLFTTSGTYRRDFTDDPAAMRTAMQGITGRPEAATQARVAALGAAEPTPSGPPSGVPGAIAATNGLNNSRTSTAQVGTSNPFGSETGLPTHADGQSQAEAAAQYGYIKNGIEWLGKMPGERVLVYISAGFSLHMDTSQLLLATDLANRLKVVINALDARGLYAPTIDAGGGAHMDQQANLQQLRANPVNDRMQSFPMLVMAQETGGTFFRDSNDLTKGMNEIGTAPEVYYVLGFNPTDTTQDGSYHKLKVTTTRLNHYGDAMYSVQARKGYFAPKPEGDPKVEAHNELEDALFSQDEIRDLPMVWQTQYIKKDAENGELEIRVKLQMRDAPFRQENGRHANSITLATSIYDSHGNFVTGDQKVVDLNLTDATYQKLLQDGITLKVNIPLAPGNYMVREVVRESEGSEMAARNGSVVAAN